MQSNRMFLLQVPSTVSIASEPGMQIGGAVYYQSPTPQRPAHEGTTYYATPAPSVSTEPTGTTFYPSQQLSATPPSGGTYYPPTPKPEKQGAVFYDTKAQTSVSSTQAKPRVKNIIPIVKPEVCSV